MSCIASVVATPISTGMADSTVDGRAISAPSTRNTGAQASTSMPKSRTAGSTNST
ncbi:hypothetical protein D3C72_2509530 [compost metagenome]